MWENIYLYNGTFHIISSDPDSLPPAGYVMRGTPAGGRQHQAAGEDRWRVISPGEAIEVLGAVAMRKEGISVGPRVRALLWLVQDALIALSLSFASFCHRRFPETSY